MAIFTLKAPAVSSRSPSICNACVIITNSASVMCRCARENAEKNPSEIQQAKRRALLLLLLRE
jgi:hypothetical protein